jgi:hypothetical protein
MEKERTEVIEEERSVISALSDELGAMLIAHYCHLDEDCDLRAEDEIMLARSRAALGLAQMLKQMSQTKCGVVFLIAEDPSGEERAIAHRFGYDPQGEAYATLFREIGALSYNIMLLDVEAEMEMRRQDNDDDDPCGCVAFGKDDGKA